MGILGSLFFLHIALIGCSMFLAVVQGLRKRFVVFFLVIMILAVWMPVLTMNVQSAFSINAEEAVSSYNDIYTPTKLFWLYRQTEVRINDFSYVTDDTIFNNNQTTNNNYDTCHIPIISQLESNNYKTPEQRETVSPDQFFTGCYVSAGWGSTSWSSTRKLNIGTAIWWFFPYYHFLTIWGNFCGYTAYDPNLDFQAEQMTMTAGQLARDAFPTTLPPNNSGNTSFASLFPQGSMIQHETYYTYTSPCAYGGCPELLSNCPAVDYNNGAYGLCESISTASTCPRALDPSPAEGKSVYFMFVMLMAVSFTYMLMAAYWGIVFLGGAGTYPMYFFLLPSYWFGATQQSSINKRGDHNNDRNTTSNNHMNVSDDEDNKDADGTTTPHSTRTGTTNECVKVMNVGKSYGTVQALKPVTFEMACGEVTALLGHNGAGT
jgi:ABC-type multidrug transport system fused ATPase/permease subunit